METDLVSVNSSDPHWQLSPGLYYIAVRGELPTRFNLRMAPFHALLSGKVQEQHYLHPDVSSYFQLPVATGSSLKMFVWPSHTTVSTSTVPNNETRMLQQLLSWWYDQSAADSDPDLKDNMPTSSRLTLTQTLNGV